MTVAEQSARPIVRTAAQLQGSVSTQNTRRAQAALSGSARMDAIFSKIVASKYAELPPLWKGLFYGPLTKHNFTPSSLAQTLNTSSDELPARRFGLKPVHTFGTVAKFEFVGDPSTPYTGLWKGGYGVMRFSYAAPPIAGNIPGVAFKFVVDGKPSENIVAMHGLGAQGESTSVFFNVFSNKIDMPESGPALLIAKLFQAAVSNGGDGLRQSATGIASTTQAGIKEAKPVAPWRLYFEPTPEARAAIPNSTRGDFRADLASLPAGTPIYRVFGAVTEGSTPIVMGSIVTRSAFVASSYGDRVLFFQHRVDPK
ncbi:MAG: hypothetical protein HY059_04915 [Proteobacteria bacterium]|nr:hypothetical protein [Pseudomonadota bacterium]